MRRAAFLAAAVCGGSVLTASSAQAEDLFSALQRAFGGGQAAAPPPAPVVKQPQAAPYRQRRRDLIRESARRERNHENGDFDKRRASSEPRPNRRVRYASLSPQTPPIKTFVPLPGGPDFSGSVDPALVAEERKAFADAVAGKDAGWLSGRQTMCVRLCDGYAFPIDTLRSVGDLTVHQTACRAACPGATTVLFSRPEGGELSAAVSVGGRAYPTLRTAFAYQQKKVPACGCQAEGGVAYTPLPIERDPTLRAGDIVAGKATLFVMLAGKLPRLVDFRQDRTLTKTARLAMEKVIGYQPPRVMVRLHLVPSDSGAPRADTDVSVPTENDVRVVLPRIY